MSTENTNIAGSQSDEELDNELIASLNQDDHTIEVVLADDQPASAEAPATTAEPTAAAPAAPDASPAPGQAGMAPGMVAVPQEVLQQIAQRILGLERHVADRQQIETQATQLYTQQQLEGRIADVRAKLTQAIENGDTTKQVELQDSLADLRAELKVAKVQPVQPQPVMAQPQQPQAPRGPNVHAQAWIAKQNSWYNRPGFEFETQAVRLIDEQMAREGFNTNTPEYFAELDKRIAAKMPNLAKQVAPASAAPPKPVAAPVAPNRVAAPARAVNAAGKRTIVLGPDDRRRMEAVGLDPKNPLHAKRYAAELVASQAAEQQ